MMSFLRTLKLPETWLDFVDLLSKTVVAAAAAAISIGVWLYKDSRETADKAVAARVDAQKAEFDQRMRILSEISADGAERRQNIELFLNILPKSADDADWRIKTQSLSAYCVEQSKGLKLEQRPPLLAMLCDANATRSIEFASKVAKPTTPVNPNDGAVYASSPTATAQASKLAAVEAAGDATPSQSWYAVVASVPLSQPETAQTLARSLNLQLAAVTGTCDVWIYQTQISRSFAITSGQTKTEVAAKARTNLIRNSGVVPDAFAQPDKGWTVSPLEQPAHKEKAPCN